MREGNLSCPQCEREVDDSLTWCPHCGTEMRPQAAAVPPSQAAMDETDFEAEFADDEPVADESADPFAPTMRGTLPGDAIEPATAAPSSSSAKVVALALGGLLLVGAVVAWFLVRDDDRGDLSVTAVAVGDCWNDPDGVGVDTEVADIPEVPCDEPHDNEVFALIDLPWADGAGFPGQFEVEVEAFRICLSRFESYVGVPFGESPLDIYTLSPTMLSWLDGDREVICSAYMLDESTMTGSVAGTSERMIRPALDLSGVDDCATLADRTIIVAQQFIDYFDATPPEQLDAAFSTPTPELLPIAKSESLLIARAGPLGCSFDDLNALVINRAGALTWETEIGGLVADEIIVNGFFVTG